MSLSHAELFPSSAQIRENPLGWQAAAQERWAQLGIHPEWFEVLTGLGPALGALGDALAARSEQGEHILPAPQRVMRALELAPSQVRVLIVGQDPYPTPGHGVGLSFAVEPQVRPLPRSLQNLRTELHDDAGVALPAHGDLGAWQEQGVMLLNRTLTVAAGDAGSHAKLGWGPLTDAVVRHLGSLEGAPVAILWGKHAQQLTPLLAGHPVIASAHPSPLSARRGFFGSRPFSAANRELEALGLQAVDWSLPELPELPERGHEQANGEDREPRLPGF